MGGHRPRFGVLIASLAVSGAGLATNVVAADESAPTAEDPAVQVLPPLYAPGQPWEFWTGDSSEYAMLPAKVDGTGGYREIVRVSDGNVAKTFPVASRRDQAGLLRISGVNAIWRRQLDGRTTVVSENLQTGTMEVLPIPAGDRVLDAHPGWALTGRDYPNPSVHLLRADGSDTEVLDECAYSTGVYAADSDATAVIFSCSNAASGHWLVNATTGAARTVNGWELTPNRVYGFDSHDDNTTTVTWADRSALDDVHTVELNKPFLHLTTLGDSLATGPLRTCSGGLDCLAELRPIDLEAGTVGEVVADEVLMTAPTSDGGLMLKVRDGDVNRLALIRPGESKPAVFTPALSELARPYGLALAGSRVIASSGPSSFEHKNGSWSEIVDPLTGEPFRPVRVTSNAMLALAEEDVTGSTDRWRVAWPEGARDVMTSHQVRLGRGGKLLSVSGHTEEGHETHSVQDVQSGKSLWSSGLRPVLDGNWAWVLDRGVLVGRDLLGTGTTKRRAAGIDYCGGGQLADVRGRWAIVQCSDLTYVVDLRSDVHPWRAPYGDWLLGDDFIFDSFDHWDAYPGDYPIRIVDLSSAHRQRVVTGSGVRAVVDDAPSRRLVHTDAFGRAVVRTLDWIGEPPARGDRTAPRLVSTGGSPRVVITDKWRAQVTFRWRFIDPQTAGEELPAGLAEHEFRYQVTTLRDGHRTAWDRWGLDLSRSSVSRYVHAGERICFQARARDGYDNVSSWSGSRCSAVDRTPPRLVDARASADGAPIAFWFMARDESGIASHRVQYRIGRSTRPWVSPWAWRNVKGNQVIRKVAVGQRICFRFNAVDKVGRRSNWSPASCTTRRR